MRKVSNSTVLVTFYVECKEDIHALGYIDLIQEKFDMHRHIIVCIA